jgi:hypothetical protein
MVQKPKGPGSVSAHTEAESNALSEQLHDITVTFKSAVDRQSKFAVTDVEGLVSRQGACHARS